MAITGVTEVHTILPIQIQEEVPVMAGALVITVVVLLAAVIAAEVLTLQAAVALILQVAAVDIALAAAEEDNPNNIKYIQQ
jgi:hypothetical protein